MRDKKPELLVPAGGLDTLKVAVDYGADAVYIGGQAFGLRAKADNFSINRAWNMPMHIMLRCM